jgi:hypothetical protein
MSGSLGSFHLCDVCALAPSVITHPILCYILLPPSWTPPQGSACIDIKATYATGPIAFTTFPSYADLLNTTLPASTVFTQTVCL